MKKIFLIPIILVTLLVACKKDELASKKLQGTWNITSLKTNGEEAIVADTTTAKITFSEIDANAGNYTLKFYLLGLELGSTEGTFTINDDATSIQLTDEDNLTTNAEIITLTNTDFEIRSIDAVDVTVIKGEKE
jgi:hypothetical protein